MDFWGALFHTYWTISATVGARHCLAQVVHVEGSRVMLMSTSTVSGWPEPTCVWVGIETLLTSSQYTYIGKASDLACLTPGSWVIPIGDPYENVRVYPNGVEPVGGTVEGAHFRAEHYPEVIRGGTKLAWRVYNWDWSIGAIRLSVINAYPGPRVVHEHPRFRDYTKWRSASKAEIDLNASLTTFLRQQANSSEKVEPEHSPTSSPPPADPEFNWSTFGE